MTKYVSSESILNISNAYLENHKQLKYNVANYKSAVNQVISFSLLLSFSRSYFEIEANHRLFQFIAVISTEFYLAICYHNKRIDHTSFSIKPSASQNFF